MRKIFYIIIAAVLACSCGSRRQAAGGQSHYARRPITEVSAEVLREDSLLIEAAGRQMAGADTAAEALLRDLLKENPKHAAAHYELGRLLIERGETDSALAHTQAACTADRKNVWYAKQLASKYMGQHDVKRLTETWERIVRQNPDVTEYYYDLSNAYLLTNDVGASIDALNRVEKRFGLSEEVSLQKQRLWNAVGETAKARRELERLAEAIPNDTKYNSMIAQSLMEEKEYGKALEFYQRVAAADPDEENVHISMAECYLRMGRYPQSYAQLRTGLMNPQIDCRTKLTYLNAFLRTESFFNAYVKQAMLLADTLMQDCPPGDGHCHTYGLMLAAQERYAEAVVQLQKALAADSGRYEIWDALMVCLEKSECPPDSLKAVAEAAALRFPLKVRPWLILALYYTAEGDCERARTNVARCRLLAPKEEGVQRLYQQVMQQCP